MARLFNVVVFDETISGDSGGSKPIYYSNPSHHALLGSADVLNVQVIVESVSAVTTVVTVVYQISNSAVESEWKDSSKSATVTVAGYTSADLPGMTFFAVDANIDLSAYGRFKVYADKNGACKVRIIACGRSL